ncbi:MAG: helix-turn-helix domain-containing protein [Enterobacter hormaechei]|nr:helix-turn-helix domain-containing protein [Enterobacter hormaechei]
MNNFFSNNIKSLRVDNDFTQQEIADALGITRSRYSNYENGINEPSLDILIRLSKLFNCSIDDLLKIKINTIIKNKIDSIITEEPETSLGLNEFNYSDLKKKLIENRNFYEKKKKTILGEIDVKISEIDSVLDFINNLYTKESLNEISHNKKDE